MLNVKQISDFIQGVFSALFNVDSVTTTDTSVTTLSIITPESNKTTTYKIYINAFSTTTSDWGAWEFTVISKKINTANPTIELINSDVSIDSFTQSFQPISFNIDSDNINLQVQSEVTANIEWKCRYEKI